MAYIILSTNYCICQGQDIYYKVYGQRNFLYEMSTSAILIFSKCVFLINVTKCKFDPNETIIMYGLSLTLSGPAFSVVRQARGGGGGRGLRGPDAKNQS